MYSSPRKSSGVTLNPSQNHERIKLLNTQDEKGRILFSHITLLTKEHKIILVFVLKDSGQVMHPGMHFHI